jgi:hypothetical protein
MTPGEQCVWDAVCEALAHAPEACRRIALALIYRVLLDNWRKSS